MHGLPGKNQRGCKRKQDDGQSEYEQAQAGIEIASQVTGNQSGERDSTVTRKLVEAGGNAALLGSHYVEFAGHRHRPGKPLIYAQQHIGCDDPVPRGRIKKNEGNWQRNEPTPDQDLAAADFFRHAPRDEIHRTFYEAETNDEGHQQSEGAGRHTEFGFRQRRHNGALHADRQADEKNLQ